MNDKIWAVNVLVPKDKIELKEKLKLKAKACGMSQVQYVKQLIKKDLEK